MLLLYNTICKNFCGVLCEYTIFDCGSFGRCFVSFVLSAKECKENLGVQATVKRSLRDAVFIAFCLRWRGNGCGGVRN